MASLPTPIPSFSPSSGSAAQTAHIKSLELQLQELVAKNNTLVAQHSQYVEQFESRLRDERVDAQDIVRRLKDASMREKNDLKDAIETVKLAAKHQSLMMLYNQDVSKRSLAALETDLETVKHELLLRSTELAREKSANTRLQFKLDEAERVYLVKLEEIANLYEASQNALLASKAKNSTMEGKQVVQLKDELQNSLSALRSTEDDLKKASSDLEALQTDYEHLILELNNEKREKSDAERERKEMKDQIALWRRLEGKEAESIKESKKRIQELEVSLATARSHAIELEERVAELEESVARVEKEKLRAEKNNSRLEGEKDGLEKVKERLEGDKGRLEKELKRWKKSVKEEGSEKENTPEDKKGKKRSREEEHDKLRATKKAKLEMKSKKKEKPLKPPKSATAQGYTPAPITFSPKSYSSTASEDKAECQPPKSNPSKPSAFQLSNPALKPSPTMKLKARPAMQQFYEEEKEGEGWAIEGSLAAPKPRTEKLKPGMKEKSKARKPKPQLVGPRDEEPEYFNVDAISSAEEEDGEQVKETAKPKPKEKGKHAPKAKEPKKKDAEIKKAAEGRLPATMSRETTIVGAKPKKRGLNLLATMTTGGFGAMTSWATRGGDLGGLNIPVDLSSPEKGGSAIPRARFDFGGY